MGVTGLLQVLKDIQRPTDVSKYRGKTLAVDTYGWLHRGLISCAQDLCQDVPTRSYITLVMKKVEMLRHFGVEPYLVFDGASLPTKAETAKERREKRDEARKKAADLVRKGDTRLAWKEFMKAAGVTPEMAKSVMVELDMNRVKYVVAPYEADPQMVYLEKMGLVDGILLEDSDLLVFGCNTLITKLKDTGSCIEINRADFERVKAVPNLASYTAQQLRLVAMLAGCDYTKGVPGIGLKTAFSLVRRHVSLEKVVAALRADGKTIPEEFHDEVVKADLAFQFQKVFNPIQRCLDTLNQYPHDMELDLAILELCCGRTLEHDIHVKICTGRAHPYTHGPLIAREQSLSLKSKSVNLGSHAAIPAARSKSYTLPTPKNTPGSIDMFFGRAEKVTMPSGTVNGAKTPAMDSKRELDKSIKLSPVSKKVRRVLQVKNVPDTGSQMSKFFGEGQKTPLRTPKLPTPVSNKVQSWDNSMFSGDSDVPDDFSSPVAKMQLSKTRDFEEMKTSELRESDIEEIEDSVQTEMSPKAYSREALPEDEDDEIEESPVKSTESSKLGAFALKLREKYLMDSKHKVTLKLKTTLQSHGVSVLEKTREVAVKDTVKKARTLLEDEFGAVEPVLAGRSSSQTVALSSFAYRG